MPKNSFMTRVQVAHWDARVQNPFHFTPNMAQAILVGAPLAGATPVTLKLILPRSPGDGDWYSWSDPLGLIGQDVHLEISSPEGFLINGLPNYNTTQDRTSGTLVFDTVLQGWALISPFPVQRQA